MTTEGDGTGPDAVDSDDSTTESVDSLLSELLGPEFSSDRGRTGDAPTDPPDGDQTGEAEPLTTDPSESADSAEPPTEPIPAAEPPTESVDEVVPAPAESADKTGPTVDGADDHVGVDDGAGVEDPAVDDPAVDDGAENEPTSPVAVSADEPVETTNPVVEPTVPMAIDGETGSDLAATVEADVEADVDETGADDDDTTAVLPSAELPGRQTPTIVANRAAAGGPGAPPIDSTPAEPAPSDGTNLDGLDDTRPVTPAAGDGGTGGRFPGGRLPTGRLSGGPLSGEGVPGGRVAFIAVAGIVGLYVLLIAAWGVDAARNQSQVMGNVTLDGVSISGLDESELGRLLDDKQEELAAAPMEVAVGETTVSTDPVTMGASVDRDEIVAEAFAVGRTGFFLFRPFSWLARLFDGPNLETQYQYDAEITAGAAESVVAAELDQPQEPELVLDGNEQFVVEPGRSGTTINARELVGRLPTVIEAGAPYRLELQAESADPEIDQAALETVASEINTATADPVRIRVLDDAADVQPAMLKAWTVVDTTAEPLTWTIDQEQVLSDLRPLFPELGTEDQKARFTIVNSEPIIVPASETVICCKEESLATIRPKLAEPVTADEDAAEGVPSKTIELEPEIVSFDEGVAELESLGIIEEVSSFTTEHACCENRVVNIQRFADLMQGAIIRPGETISLNEYVGERTLEKGFVADSAINLGVLEPQVGGGISQYATTFFNASFFAGLEFIEYQSHSLYISRYPRGREATISWRQPDLKVKNTTPYGVLIWNSYTDTSITVTFYSTKHLEVEALELRRSSERECRVDITPRVITYPDGSKVEDSVYAVYRPGEGLDCNGESTQPEEDAASSTSEAEAPAGPVTEETPPSTETTTTTVATTVAEPPGEGDD